MGKKIMIVDDSKTIRQQVSFTLTKGGYEVIEAEDGADGIEKLKANFGDRSMTDLSLPVSVVAADLEAGEPIPLRDWPVHQAIRAALSIPGLAPPYRHGARRLMR